MVTCNALYSSSFAYATLLMGISWLIFYPVKTCTVHVIDSWLATILYGSEYDGVVAYKIYFVGSIIFFVARTANRVKGF